MLEVSDNDKHFSLPDGTQHNNKNMTLNSMTRRIMTLDTECCSAEAIYAKWCHCFIVMLGVGYA